MYYYFLDFLDSLSNPPSDIGREISYEPDGMGSKGYGTPESEMKFLHEIFSHIQESHPEFESFSWEQSNQYNDNYDHFQLASFTANDRLTVNSDISFYFRYSKWDQISSTIFFETFDDPDPDQIEYAKENNITIDDDDDRTLWQDFWRYKKEKYKPLEIPCLKFLVFLKLLEINFSMYYFLYTFGNGVEVKFNKEGVVVTKFDQNDW